jgi:hypothetical protein
MAETFLGRWSQRKQALREGRALEEPTVPVQTPAALAEPEPNPALTAELPSVAPALTLEDAARLTSDSDFKPFALPDVAPEVRNAAMKKLFSDPHFGVMDRMDVYIDDYSLADPLPASMLRQLASASFLQLFDEEPKPADGVSAPNNPAPASGIHHDHTDLRLQPNDAAEPQEPGRGTQ